MLNDRFKFISPGVFIEEIDKSLIPALPERMGPIIIGRFKKGPSNRPVKVKDYNEFTEVFGTPAPGNASGDIWRTGAMTAPTYAAYAAQAWLRNNTPCTILRVLGVEHADKATLATSGGISFAGWRTDNAHSDSVAASTAVGGAYGLLVMPDPDSVGHGATTSSISIKIAPDATITTTPNTADGARGHLLLGIPNQISGAATLPAAGTASAAANCLGFLFVDNGDVGTPGSSSDSTNGGSSALFSGR